MRRFADMQRRVSTALVFLALVAVSLAGCELGDADGASGTDRGSGGSPDDLTPLADICAMQTELLQPDPDGTPSGLFECEAGFVHRERAEACEIGSWATGTCEQESAGGNSECLTDSDCTDKADGHCFSPAFPEDACVCEYSCRSDAGCEEDQACFCNGARSSCVPATCRTDDDCPDDSLCALQEKGDAGGCNEPGSRRLLRCTAPQDTCRVHTECGDDVCSYDFDATIPRTCVAPFVFPCG